ncbi:hypothetical protein YQE_03556, partial [Dendroctonus ponderosae]
MDADSGLSKAEPEEYLKYCTTTAVSQKPDTYCPDNSPDEWPTFLPC